MVAAAAYAACLRLAQQHYENFPVASRLLPSYARPHIAAIYAFARTADDFADEGDRSDAFRLALLDDWRDRLHAAVAGHPPGDESNTAAIFVALGETIRKFGLDVSLFENLLSAFRQDVVVKRYETWDDVFEYCRRSANPIGRLVLRIAEYHDDRLDVCADAVCTALQLTNFWQDLEIDWQRGRLYLPLTLVRACGADEQDLERRTISPQWRAVLADAVARTRALYAAGRPVADGVSGRLRWELRATWLGGMRVLDRFEHVGYDVFRARPVLGWRDALSLGWHTLAWTPSQAGALAGGAGR